MTGREDVERVVAEDMFGDHWFEDGGDDCVCGYWAGFDSMKRHHLEDAFAAVIAPLIEQARQDGAVEALREAGTAIEKRRLRRRRNWLRGHRWSGQDEARWSQGMWDALAIVRRAERAAQTPQEGLGAPNGPGADSGATATENG